MKTSGRYVVEYLFLGFVFVLAIGGFWNIYFGADADPDPHHHLHVASNFLWLCLLLLQLALIDRGQHRHHRKVGLAVFLAAPLLVATTAMLSVHSAHKGVVSGDGDFLIVQNVLGTLELAFLIVAAFVLRTRRKLHAAFLLSTALMFMGIALFFALISFAPMFRIEGPETFYRFQTAAITGQVACVLVGVLFFIRDFRSGWPFLLAGAFFVLNEVIRSLLAKHELLQPLTETVGAMSQSATSVAAFVVVLVSLAATGTGRGSQSARNDGRAGSL